MEAKPVSDASSLWVAHASRVLVSASRRNNLFLVAVAPVFTKRQGTVRDREDALASTRDA